MRQCNGPILCAGKNKICLVVALVAVHSNRGPGNPRLRGTICDGLAVQGSGSGVIGALRDAALSQRRPPIGLFGLLAVHQRQDEQKEK